PTSGMSDKMDFRNVAALRAGDEVKFVIQDRNDYEWAKDVLRKHALERRPGKVLFSPAHPFLPARELAAWILADRLSVRMQVPLHRVLWPEATRGK
ncbi:MAG: 7-carboxy-7-deazaguanine synthase QueE, partial [bacterium]